MAYIETVAPAARVEWVSGTTGSVFVNPDHVSAVEKGPYGTHLHLVGGQTIILHDERSTEEIADAMFGPGAVDTAI